MIPRYYIILTAILLLGAVASHAQTTSSMNRSGLLSPTNISSSDFPRFAVVGNPERFPEWTPELMESVKRAGFNAVQLNIAWLIRPNDEALNLRDVVTVPGDTESTRTAARRTELRKRNVMAKRAGLRTMFHFGSPYMWRNPDTGEEKRHVSEAYNSDPPWFDSANPKVIEHETALLREFRQQFPDVDDILVYTYDQDAWQASEFSSSKLSRGIPLHGRLPKYLKALYATWSEGRTTDSGIMWWEPWELSAGQIYKIIPQLPTAHFGMMLHSNIAEVQISKPVDVWYRNTARMCADRGIPVIGEGFFGSMTEEVQPLFVPCPRLVDEQFLVMASVKGITGLKEYFGILPDKLDPNLDVFTARLQSPGVATEDLVEQTLSKYGEHKSIVAKIFAELSNALQEFPWDASWYARLAGTADIDHGWSGAFIRGLQVETPSWRSTRYAHFMMTVDDQPHPYMLEDVQLRCEVAAESMATALADCRKLIPLLPAGEQKEMFERIKQDVDKLRRVTISYALHLRETNVAQLLRQDLESSRPLAQHLTAEMKELLRADVENQGGKGRVVEMEKLFHSSPEEFLRKHLIPSDKDIKEKGHFTLTTR